MFCKMQNDVSFLKIAVTVVLTSTFKTNLLGRIFCRGQRENQS